ncbi:hypothetical protein M3Y94_00177400 [Aphelenchoides besseyi]|nr:hypothetical protein M3Y94_00177400 [Aphelenchoides besseyi]KAI6236916.1 hypothetical protein M3Y95_00209800 [Aphelenchoides besseyi]
MSTLKFNRIANLIVSTGELIPQNSTLSASIPSVSPIIYEKDIGMLGRAVSRTAQQSVRRVSAVATPPGKKPTLEEFDPLNPGGWQLGAAGKILPRLPEGTRCGKLVMGKYGLYDPKLRKRVEAFQAGLDAGKKSEEATPRDARMALIGKILAHMAFLVGMWNLTVLTLGRPLWPYQNVKPPGSA